MPVTARVFILLSLALLVGVCVVYVPVLTFAVVGTAFAAGLWSLLRINYRKHSSRGVVGDAQKNGRRRDALGTRMVSIFLMLWWLASISPIFAFSPRDVTSAAEASGGGSLQYQVLLIGFGCVGAFFLPRAMKRFDPAFRWVAVLWALHVSWMFISLIWSIYPPLTFRNAVAFVLVSVGAFGLGAGFYGTVPNGRGLFLRHVFTAGVLSALAVILPLPFRWQEYALLDPSQRLDIGGNFPAFVVGPVLCALLVFVGTAVLEMRVWRARDWLWVAVLVLPLLVLKSRGPMLFAALALIVPYLVYKSGVQNRVLQVALLSVTGLGAYVFYSEGVYDYLIPYLTRGNVESTASLTGRIPLWEVVLTQIQDHPWLGVGFAAFWNSQNYPKMEQLVGFPVVSAHNGFLDMLLASGIVGLAFLLTFCLCAMVTVTRRARRSDPLGWLTLVFLTFYVLSNLTTSIFTEFYEFKLIVVLAALGLLASGPAKRLGAPPREKTVVARPRAPSLG